MPIFTETFGGYTANIGDILQQFQAWMLKHPKVHLPTGFLYADEGYYMTIYWDEQ